MKIFKYCFSLVIFSLIFTFALSAPEYSIENTSLGKVVVGLTQEEVLQEYGSPDLVRGNVWYYDTEQPFYAYLKNKIYLYPDKIKVSLGSPVELKVLIDKFDKGILDITRDSEFIVSDEESFIVDEKNVIFPKREGSFQIFAKYRNRLTNICNLEVTNVESEKEKISLMQIVTFPSFVETVEETRIEFSAFGVFKDTDKKIVYIENISNRANFLLRSEGKVTKQKDRFVKFFKKGRYELFCTYSDVLSEPNEVVVYGYEEFPGQKRSLREIKAFPGYVSVFPDYRIEFKAFANFLDNNFHDVTYPSNWFVKDTDIMDVLEKGKFLARQPGVTEVIARYNQDESLPLKIVVNDKKKTEQAPTNKMEKRISFKDLFEDTKEEIEDFKEDISSQYRKIVSIKLSEEYVELGLGQEFDLKAIAVYDDGKEEDVTFLSRWLSSQEKTAVISKGRLKAMNTGSALVSCEYKNIRSLPATVNVGEEKLLSIAVKPENISLDMTERVQLFAEGFYSDQSKRDITSLVDWHCEKEKMLVVSADGELIPKSPGSTNLVAKYLDVESLPISLSVRYGLKWFFLQALKLMLLLMALGIFLFIVMYFVVEAKKAKLLILKDKDSRQFMLKLYENLSRLLTLAGSMPLKGDAYLAYAEYVQNKYQIKDDCFLDIVKLFEKAKFSSYDISEVEKEHILNNYNLFLNSLFSSLKKTYQIHLRIKSVFYRVVLLIKTV